MVSISLPHSLTEEEKDLLTTANLNVYAQIIKIEGKKVNVTGVIKKCPVCAKKINYEIHNNGHIWAKCKTGCINFLQ